MRPFLIATVVLPISATAVFGQAACKGALADPKVQSFAAEVWAQMRGDFDSPAAARHYFAKMMEDRAKQDKYPPITGGGPWEPDRPHPVRLGDIIVSLKGGTALSLMCAFQSLRRLMLALRPTTCSGRAGKTSTASRARQKTTD